MDSTKQQLIQAYQQVREKTETLCQPLVTEDYVIQGIEDVSPPKWHLAHTAWFFETFILIPNQPSYQIFSPLFQQLFNSYYQALGSPYPRSQRGILSRPTVKTIYHYRKQVDEEIIRYLESLSNAKLVTIMPLLILGIQHEQQHQELLLMDIKYNFSQDPGFPVYQPESENTPAAFFSARKFIHL